MAQIGPTGPPGNQGPPGRPGERGPQGPTGAAGPRGPQGYPGERGLRGDQGGSGVTGDTGPTGPDGLPGVTGPVGLQGEVGPTGGVGATGPTGAQGSQGDRGEPGATGARGLPGPSGPTGPQGARGLQGDTGERGPRGFPGATGADGRPGTPGSDGASTWAGVHNKPLTFPPIIGPGPGDAVAGNDPRLTNSRTPTAHTHAISSVTGLQDALDGKQGALGYSPESVANRGQPLGYASLDANALVPFQQLPPAVVEYANKAAFPLTGEATGRVYVAKDTNDLFRWAGSEYVRVGAAAVVPAPATSNSSGVAGQTAFDSGFFYVCVSANTWKRTPLSGW